ncbi:18407_t:CDS:2, partial [Racocetra fulgida]
SLPKDEIPTALLATTVIVNLDPTKTEHYTGYSIDPIDEKDPGDDTNSDDGEESKDDLLNRVDSLTELRNSELFETIISEDTNSNNNENDSSQDDDCENDEHDLTSDEMFIIVNSGKQINAVNLRIDYMYRGKQLKNMCLYDYISTIHKIKINDKEIDKLNRQKTREGHATRVDRFLFLGGEKKCNETCDHTYENPEIAKVQRIERSVIGYDNTGDAVIQDDQDDLNFSNLTSSSPYEIMRSGLCNVKFVNDAMLHLYLKDKFNDKKKGQSSFQEEPDTIECDNEDEVRCSCENDNYLVKAWQNIISSRKKMEQMNNNMNPEEIYIQKPSAHTTNQKKPDN